MHACRRRPSPGPALTAPPSPTRCSRLPASLYVAIEQIQNRRLGRCHREVPRASPPPSHPPRAAVRVPPLALRRPRGPGWQESHRMHPFFVECAKKAPFLATSARNACFSRSRWQHLRPMHPFPGAIGRFRIHGVRILPPRAHFRVEEPEITHGAKMLPAPRGLSAAAACGQAEWALRHAAAACDTRHGRTGFAPCGVGLACLLHAPPCHLACARRGLRSLPSRPSPSPPSCTRRASPPASRPPCPAIRRAAHCGRGERRSGPSCRPRAAHADASRPSMRARRHRLGPNPCQPSPSPEPTESRPPVELPAPIRAPPPAAPHPAARVPLRFR